MNCKEYLINKLKDFKREDVVFSTHAKIRMIQRQIDEEEVIENILNPVRLYYVIEEQVNRFDCYFNYSKTLCHRYIIALENKIIVITAVKINRRWQSHLEKRIKR